MSSVAFDIAARLSTLGFGVVGTDILVEALPDTETTAGWPQDNVIGVFAFESGEPVELSMGESVAFEFWGIQLQVRNKDKSTAEANAYSIFNDLPTSSEVNINSTGYNRISRGSVPKQFSKPDNKGRLIWMVEFAVQRRPDGVTA